MGVLEPLIRDNYIEDISCSGLGNIFVEHKIFGGLKAAIGYETNEELDKFVIQLAERIKHPVTFREPTVDATLPDGSRINIVYGTDTFLFKGYQNSYLLEYKIAPKRGLPVDKRREVYNLLKTRAAVLRRLQEQNITNFYDVYAILAKAYRNGQFK